MSALTDFETALRELLADRLGMRIMPGLIEGPVERGDVGCLLVGIVGELGGRVEEAQVTCTIRAYKAFQQVKDPAEPYDPTPLYALRDQLYAAVQANQTGLGMWDQRITICTVDVLKQGIEAQLLAQTFNPSLVQG